MTIGQALNHRSGQPANPNLSPDQFRDMYRNCSVVLGDGHVGQVSIHKYRINRNDPENLDPSGRIRDDVADDERAEIGPLLRRWCSANGTIGQRISTIAFNERKLNQMFFGKGAPKDISLLLTVISELGRLRTKYPQMNEQNALQRYCDDHVGVDCSGLVNNFFIASGHFTDTNQNCQTRIREYGRADRRLDFLPDHPRTFILAWKSMGHIAIIDRWHRRETELQVVESSASLLGIRSTVYEIEEPSDLSRPPAQRFWKVRRLAQNRSLQKVYMVGPMPRR